MIRKGKDVETVPEEQKEKSIVEGKKDEKVLENDALFRELSEVLELSENENTVADSTSTQNRVDRRVPEKNSPPEQSPEQKPCANAAEVSLEKTEDVEKEHSGDISHTIKGAEQVVAADPLETIDATKRMPVPKEKKCDAEQADRSEDQAEFSLSGIFSEANSKKDEQREEQLSEDVVDDENLIAELRALIGEPVKPKPAQRHASSAIFAEAPKPLNAAAPRPRARITPEALQDVPEEFEDVAEADTMGVPGWLKGNLILLLSLLLGAMTFYAVASDVFGEIF